MKPTGFTGAVLCGGQSSRFGRDKATYAHEGTPLAKVSLLALREAGASEVFSVGGDVYALAEMGFRAVPDDYPGEGPLGGIVCALKRATDSLSYEDICVVLACDLPWASAATVREVIAELESDQNLNAVFPTGEDDILQYLHGAWRLRCLPALEAAFDRGGRAVKDGLEMLAEGTVGLCRVSSMKSLTDMDEIPPKLQNSC